MKKFLLACIPCISFVSACNTPQPPPAVLRWANTSKLSGSVYNEPRLHITSTQGASPASVTVKDLPERAAAAYITAISSKEKDSDKFKGELSKSIGAQGDKSEDRTKLSRIVYVTLLRSDFHPADRFLFTSIILKAENFEFADYVGSVASITPVTVEKVTTSGENDANAKLDPTFAGTLVGTGEVGVAGKAMRGEAYDVNENAFSQVGVDSKSVEIYSRGAKGIDLVGTTAIKLAVKPKVDPASIHHDLVVTNGTLHDDKGVLTATKASLKFEELDYVTPLPLTVCARLDYIDRRVTDGEQFYDESPQTVTLASPAPKIWSRFLLVPAEEVGVKLWQIGVGPNILYFETPQGRANALFTDPLVAREFVFWLGKQTKIDKIGSARAAILDVHRKPRSLSPTDQFQVSTYSLSNPPQTVGNTCTPPND